MNFKEEGINEVVLVIGGGRALEKRGVKIHPVSVEEKTQSSERIGIRDFHFSFIFKKIVKKKST